MAGKYRVKYERDESGWWVATVPDVQGCHTQGRTLAEARRRIREALALFVDHADRAELVDDVKIPPRIRASIRRSLAARARAERVQRQASAQARAAARMLAHGELRLSLRDAAEVLDLSPQRVQQLLKTAG